MVKMVQLAPWKRSWIPDHISPRSWVHPLPPLGHWHLGNNWIFVHVLSLFSCFILYEIALIFLYQCQVLWNYIDSFCVAGCASNSWPNNLFDAGTQKEAQGGIWFVSHVCNYGVELIFQFLCSRKYFHLFFPLKELSRGLLCKNLEMQSLFQLAVRIKLEIWR